MRSTPPNLLNLASPITTNAISRNVSVSAGNTIDFQNKVVFPNHLFKGDDSRSTVPLAGGGGETKHIFLLLAFLLLCPLLSFSQIKQKLEQQRIAISKDILLTSQFINETRRSGKQANLDKYYILSKQIKLRESFVRTVKKEIELEVTSIERTQKVILSLEQDLITLEKEFAKMMRLAMRQKLTNSNLMFLLSSDDFSDAYHRWNYIRQFANHRKKQTALIIETQERLQIKTEQLELQKASKIKLINEQQHNVKILKNESRDINALLASLKKNNAHLKKNYQKKKNKHDQRNRVVKKILKEDKEVAIISPKPYDTKTSGIFSKNKGQLPWPVKSGFITKRFGRQAHPTLRKIEIENSGIDIRTSKNAGVYAIFDGKVKRVFSIPGESGTSVMIKHGDYFSVYSNLDAVSVKKGQSIKQGTIIGKTIVDNASNKSELHFEIWRQKTTLNPIDWIHQKAK